MTIFYLGSRMALMEIPTPCTSNSTIMCEAKSWRSWEAWVRMCVCVFICMSMYVFMCV